MNEFDLLNEQVDNRTHTDKLMQQTSRFSRASRRHALQLLAASAGVTATMLLPAFHRKNVAIAAEAEIKDVSKQASQRLEPNLFELRGYNTQITYSASSVAAGAQLSYSGRERERTFRGEEIQSESTAFGQSVTVFFTTGAADEPIETLTLLLPAIQLNSNVKELAIQTIAILSIRSAFVDPNAPLQLQTYDTISLFGSAKFV